MYIQFVSSACESIFYTVMKIENKMSDKSLKANLLNKIYSYVLYSFIKHSCRHIAFSHGTSINKTIVAMSVSLLLADATT